MGTEPKSGKGTKPKSGKRGPSTSAPEVRNILPDGFWLLVDGAERFLAFQEFPWFENATVAEIHDVSRPASNHLRWAKLDVDLPLDSIVNPSQAPLIARDGPAKPAAKATAPKRKRAAPKPRKPSRR